MEKRQEGIVVEVAGDLARVKTSRHNDCENCGACPGNSAVVLEAHNSLGARAGQRVILAVNETNMLKAAFVVYMLPLLAVALGAGLGFFFGGYVSNTVLPFQVGGGLLGGGLSFWYIKRFNEEASQTPAAKPIIIQILDNTRAKE